MKRIVYAIIPLLLIIMLTSISYADTLGSPSFVNAFVYSSSSIRITWDNNVPGATKYVLQRKTDDGSFVTIANLPSTTSSYRDSNILNGHSYVYRVYATKGGESGRAQESYPVEYLLPSGITTKAISDSEVQLTWTYPYNNKIPETNYQTAIERREEGSNTWLTITTVPGSESTYTDTGLSEGSKYIIDPSNNIYFCDIFILPHKYFGQHVSIFKCPHQSCSRVTSTSEIKISWDDVSSKETGYRIERKKGNGNFVRIGSTLPTKQAISIKVLKMVNNIHTELLLLVLTPWDYKHRSNGAFSISSII